MGKSLGACDCLAKTKDPECEKLATNTYLCGYLHECFFVTLNQTAFILAMINIYLYQKCSPKNSRRIEKNRWYTLNQGKEVQFKHSGQCLQIATLQLAVS